jgi:hypothetical protein
VAVLKQERHVELVTGTNEAFVITTLIASASIPAQLPHLNAFVIAVADVDDPKQDSLARVARISDLTTIPIGRAAGIAAPGPHGIEYLSASSTNIYDTLETANDAAVAIRDRVNALVNAWIDFTTNFQAEDPTPATYTLPYGSGTQATALIAAYKTAKQDRYQKQLVKTEADAALARAQTDYTEKQNLVSDLAAIQTAATVNQGEMTALLGGLVPLITASNTFLAAASGSPPSSGDKTTFQAAITAATAVQTASTGYVADASTLAGLVLAYRVSRIADASTAGTTLTTAQSDQITKAQQLTSAQTIEAAALAAVLAVCPDFDKHSVPFVDDDEA